MHTLLCLYWSSVGSRRNFPLMCTLRPPYEPRPHRVWLGHRWPAAAPSNSPEHAAIAREHHLESLADGSTALVCVRARRPPHTRHGACGHVDTRRQRSVHRKVLQLTICAPPDQPLNTTRPRSRGPRSPAFICSKSFTNTKAPGPFGQPGNCGSTAVTEPGTVISYRLPPISDFLVESQTARTWSHRFGKQE